MRPRALRGDPAARERLFVPVPLRARRPGLVLLERARRARRRPMPIPPPMPPRAARFKLPAAMRRICETLRPALARFGSIRSITFESRREACVPTRLPKRVASARHFLPVWTARLVIRRPVRVRANPAAAAMTPAAAADANAIFAPLLMPRLDRSDAERRRGFSIIRPGDGSVDRAPARRDRIEDVDEPDLFEPEDERRVLVRGIRRLFR